MLSIRPSWLMISVLILTVTGAVCAQQAAAAHAPDQPRAATPAATAPAAESRYVEITGFKTKIFEVVRDAGATGQEADVRQAFATVRANFPQIPAVDSAEDPRRHR